MGRWLVKPASTEMTGRAKDGLVVGELVVFRSGHQVGAVSRPITDQSTGHVLSLHSGRLTGVTVSIEEVDIADENSEGFAQLAYELIKLESRVIEERLLVYRH